jgi:putative SOS response-associated peptidase YedK
MPRWKAAPCQELLVIRRNHHTGEVSLDPLRWGLIPYWCECVRTHDPLAMCYPGLAGGTLSGRLTPRIRTIQVCPKDVPAWPWQAERETDLRRLF